MFDYIVFRVERGTVYLAGYSFEGRLRADAVDQIAEVRAREVSDVFEVENGLVAVR